MRIDYDYFARVVKTKFHYASCFEPASVMEFGFYESSYGTV